MNKNMFRILPVVVLITTPSFAQELSRIAPPHNTEALTTKQPATRAASDLGGVEGWIGAGYGPVGLNPDVAMRSALNYLQTGNLGLSITGWTNPDAYLKMLRNLGTSSFGYSAAGASQIGSTFNFGAPAFTPRAPAQTNLSYSFSGLPFYSGAASPQSNMTVSQAGANALAAFYPGIPQFQQSVSSLYYPTWGYYGYGGSNYYGYVAKTGASRSAAASFPTIQQKWQDLARLQLTSYYSSPELLKLRLEWNARTAGLVFRDPWLSLGYEVMSRYYEQIASGRPSYDETVSLSREVAGYKFSVNATEAQLVARYKRRQRLQQLSAQLQDEISAYLAANPADAKWFQDWANYINQRTASYFEQPSFVVFQEDWTRRWQQSYDKVLRSSGFVAQYTAFLNANPGVQEFLRLQNEVTALFPEVAQGTSMREYTNRMIALYQSTYSSANYVLQSSLAYSRYAQDVNSALQCVSFGAYMEVYWEAQSSQVSADENYVLMQDIQYVALKSLRQVQSKVADLMIDCRSTYGASCDPSYYPQLGRLLSDSSVADLITAASALPIAYDQFWFGYYRSDRYQALESLVAQAVAEAIAPVQPSIDAARVRYAQAIAIIPEVRNWNAKSQEYADALLSSSSALASRLARLEALASSLAGR